MTPSLDAARKVVEEWRVAQGLNDHFYSLTALDEENLVGRIAAHVRAVVEEKETEIKRLITANEHWHTRVKDLRAALAEREKEVADLRHLIETGASRGAEISPFIRRMFSVGSKARAEADALRAERERLRELLRHEIYRNHEHTDSCDACKGSDAALAPEAERGRGR